MPRKIYCHNCKCRREVLYKDKRIMQPIRGRLTPFIVKEAVCKKCNNELHIPGLQDMNIKELQSQCNKMV